MGRLEDKVALITGAAGAQGRAHAIAFAREGADVVLADITRDIDGVPYRTSTAEELAQTAAAIESFGRRSVAVEADVRDQAALDAAVARGIEAFGRIDVLVANAGVWITSGPFWEITDDEWDLTVDIDLKGTWRTMKAVAPHMVERGAGSMVVIASVNGVEAGPSYAHYTAAKHGVLGLVKTAANEIGRHGVRVNAVSPGYVAARNNDHQAAWDFMAGGKRGTREDRARAGHAWSLLARRGVIEPDSVSGAVVFLASDEARDVTGIALPVDAGHLATPGFNRDPVR
ncbi:MAG TPA: mycofactocin-coupled SDR family oxidoreductase [Capillimicrobium sp.]|nr:mycofactocin-coupled SDR family oxidoreductase [Capillimicrobium sp.]